MQEEKLLHKILDNQEKITKKLDEHSKKFTGINKKLDTHTKKFTGIEERLGNVEEKLGSVEDRLGVVEESVEFIKETAVTKTELDEKLQAHKNEILNRFDGVVAVQDKFNLELTSLHSKYDRLEEKMVS